MATRTHARRRLLLLCSLPALVYLFGRVAAAQSAQQGLAPAKPAPPRPAHTLHLPTPCPAHVERQPVQERGHRRVWYRSQPLRYVPLQAWLSPGAVIRLNGDHGGKGGFALDAGLNAWLELDRSPRPWRWILQPEVVYTLTTGPGPVTQLAGGGLGLGLHREDWYAIWLSARSLVGGHDGQLAWGGRAALGFALSLDAVGGKPISRSSAYNPSLFPLGLELGHRWIRFEGETIHELLLGITLAPYALVPREIR